MPTYRAKLILERVELRRPIIRGTEVPKEVIYDEIRIEITGTESNVALSKIIRLAIAEQADRTERATTEIVDKASNKPGPERRHVEVDDDEIEDED